MTETLTYKDANYLKAWDDVKNDTWLDNVKRMVDAHNEEASKNPTKDIYLAGGWFNDYQKFSLDMATRMLIKNKTVGYIHVPLLHQYKNASMENDEEGIFGTFEWSTATYQADITAMQLADLGVMLWDSPTPDEGTSFEQGFLTALNKPNVLVTTNDNPDKGMNLMNAKAMTAYVDQWDTLIDYDFNCIMTGFYTGKVI